MTKITNNFIELLFQTYSFISTLTQSFILSLYRNIIAF